MTIYIARLQATFLCWGPTKTAAQKEANKRANWRFVTVSPFDFTLSPLTLAAPSAAKDAE